MADTKIKTPPPPPTVTPLLCGCGKKIGTMTTATAPHPRAIMKVHCVPCGEAMIAKKTEKK